VTKPNVLIINWHDLGNFVGCYGVETVRTPAIDGLAAEGVRFANSFCTSPTCSPSRAALFTGRYAPSNGVLGLTHGQFGWDLHDDEVHLARYLADAGYRCEQFGVMHETPRRDVGYDAHHCQPHRPCLETAAAVGERIEALGREDQPWYMQVGFLEVHSPFDYGGAEPDDSRGVTIPPFLEPDDHLRTLMAAYQGAIHRADTAVGRILDALEATGQADNTIVLFTPDHGICFPRAKGSLYDPGLRVAHVMRWPGGGWQGGVVHEPMISNVDHLPTLLSALGLDVPKRLQGCSYLPLLDGGDYAPRQHVFAEQTYATSHYDPRRCVRSERYKLIANMIPTCPFREGKGRIVQAYKDKIGIMYGLGEAPNFELYDLQEDPVEFENLIDSADHQQIAAELKAALADWMHRTDDPLLHGPPAERMYRDTIAALREAYGPGTD
jgi:arylsulfatase A-like enzyme